MYKESISAAYNVLDIEIEEPPAIYDRETKNKAMQKIANNDFGS